MVRSGRHGGGGGMGWIILILAAFGVGFGFWSGALKLPNVAGSPSPSASLATAAATTDLPSIPVGQAATNKNNKTKTANSTVGTITDSALSEAIPGAMVVVGSKTDKLPSRSDIFNPFELAAEFTLPDDNVSYQYNKDGYVINIADGLGDAVIIAPCYQPKTLSVAELKKTPSQTLKRSCPDNSFFGQIVDSVSGKGIGGNILLSATIDGTKQLKIDDSGYYTASVSNKQNQNFSFSLQLGGFKQAGYKGAIDSSQPPSNTWQDITLIPATVQSGA